MVKFIEEQGLPDTYKVDGVWVKNMQNLGTYDPIDPAINIAGLNRMNTLTATPQQFSPEYIAYLEERFAKVEPMVYKPKIVTTNEEEPKVETILGNDLTTSQKWAWVIGLSFAAWALIYWSEKKLK
jgi:hypothetical protein